MRGKAGRIRLFQFVLFCGRNKLTVTSGRWRMTLSWKSDVFHSESKSIQTGNNLLQISLLLWKSFRGMGHKMDTGKLILKLHHNKIKCSMPKKLITISSQIKAYVELLTSFNYLVGKLQALSCLWAGVKIVVFYKTKTQITNDNVLHKCERKS